MDAIGARERGLAHALVAALHAAGVGARATGAGVHWQVEVAPVGPRSLEISCFWYDASEYGMSLGMNPANARRRLGAVLREPYEGPEYLVTLYEADGETGTGRTHDEAAVVACAREWLASGDLARVVARAPFVDQRARAMRALALRLDPQLRREIAGDPGYELWVYGEGRSCKVVQGSDGVECSFLLGQAQVAHAAALNDVPSAAASWLVARATLTELVEQVAGVELERHAEVLETDPAAWHWLHVRDRIADPDDVLAPLRTLIERLAASPVATRFYSYSSLYRLCFSASSHYPWVDEGLPMITPTSRSGVYAVDDTLCELGPALELIEARLSATPLRPLFGSAPHHELPALREHLARRTSALQPRLQQRGAWYDLVVVDATGAARCEVSGCTVTFHDGAQRLDVTWRSLDDAVAAICRRCEGGASSSEIAADPRVERVFRRG